VGPYFATHAEFGLQARWLGFELIRNVFHCLNAVKAWWINGQEKEKNEFVNSGQILSHLLWSTNGIFERNVQPKPIKFDHFAVLVTPMFYILIVSVILFGVEVFWQEKKELASLCYAYAWSICKRMFLWRQNYKSQSCFALKKYIEVVIVRRFTIVKTRD